MARYGTLKEELVLQPVSGKALPVLRGEVLRIIQEEGEQCVDFNAFNLHDYKEYMGISNTRSRQKFRLKKGDMVWTVSSRDRPMYLILEMPETCVTDILGGRCKASNFVSLGFDLHTNCQDTLAAAIGEYDLTPDDVHDSFNMWMNTEWDSTGDSWITKNTGRKNDYVDLLSIIDTLAVTAMCGSGDTGPISNFSLKPIRVQVYGASAETLEIVENIESRYSGIPGQRTPADFKVHKIKSDRELGRNPNYIPEFINYPLKATPIPVELSEEDFAKAEAMVVKGFAKDVGECLRVALMMWYARNRTPKASGRLRY
jgi:uncharacterized protein YcgI (DUF1989 family)